MEKRRICLMFPAFEMRYRSFDPLRLPGFEEVVSRCLKKLGDPWGLTLERYRMAYASGEVYEGLDDAEKHDLSYITSCAVADYVRERGVRADGVIPYSMGLFSALYAAGSVDLEDGWRLMRFVCRTAQQTGPRDEPYGMGVVMGVSEQSLKGLLAPYGHEIHVSDVVHETIFILSGRRRVMEALFQRLNGTTSRHAKFLPVERPYHSPFMAEAEGKIRRFLSGLRIRAPQIPFLSGVTQKPLKTATDVREEVCTNVIHPLHWRRTVQAAWAWGLSLFLECGMSESLCKLVKLELAHVDVLHPKRFKSLEELVREGAPEAEKARGVGFQAAEVACR